MSYVTLIMGSVSVFPMWLALTALLVNQISGDLLLAVAVYHAHAMK